MSGDMEELLRKTGEGNTLLFIGNDAEEQNGTRTPGGTPARSSCVLWYDSGSQCLVFDL